MPLVCFDFERVPPRVFGRIERKNLSNCLRRGGSAAMRMPTESSVALQMERFTPSQVGSRVFLRALNSVVFMMEHMVALSDDVSVVLMPSSRRTNSRPRQKTTRKPHCVRRWSFMVER